MSVVGGSFGVARSVRGGANSSRPSQYLIGFWPMQQAAEDDDEDQVTDRSGNGAHAPIGDLTPAEAWDTAGYFHGLPEVNHFAEVPLAKWPVRYTEGSLLMVGWTKCEASTGSRFIWGNGTSDAITGGGLMVAASGQLQFTVRGVGAVSSNSATSGALVYNTDSLHQWIVAYDVTKRAVSLGNDGVITLLNNTTIPSGSFDVADRAVTRGIAIGGRAGVGITNNLLETTNKLWQAYYFPGKPLPHNLATLVQRLYVQPRVWLRDEDLSF